jgi:hypothetical protein
MGVRSTAVVIVVAGLLAGQSATIGAQAKPAAPPAQYPERAVRRDIPLTNIIRKALEAGTRDVSGKPGPNYWQLEADYTINAKLDPATQTITGTEKIVIHNNSTTELRQIGLRLDHNIYRATVQRGGSVPAETTEGMVVTSIVVDGTAVDLKASPMGGGRGRGGAAAPAAPGAPAAPAPPPQMTAMGLKDTVARVNLIKPVPAKSDVTLEIAWSTKLPGGPTGQGHRMTQRFDDVLFQPTQWYPRIAKYDDLRGWDTNPYLGPSEFYNNFGRFDVRFDVPGGWIVSGTGVLQNPEEVLTAKARERLSHVLESDEVITIVGPDEIGPGQATAPGERLVWHFVADKVNDFAWATAKKYVWAATRATIPGKGAIPIHMVYQPEHAKQYANAGPIARHALEYYSSLWMPYSFPQLTLQDGPSLGMEYPMVINSNQGAADHEAGHEWWPMTVGTNETWYGWMDEGFDQYMNVLSDADARKTPANFDGMGQQYGSMSGNEFEAPMMWNSNYAGAGYSYQAYGKAPLMLSMLGGVVGDKAVHSAMSQYAKTWAFKHPSPWDYMHFMNGALKQDLGWFWYYWLFTTESVEGSIQDVATVGTKTTVTVRQDGQMPSPVVLEVKFAATGAPIKPMANATMKDETTAVVTWPVDVWFSGSRTFKAVLDFGGRKIERVWFDPSCRFPDKTPADNVWPKGAAPGTCRPAGRGGM